MSGPAEPRSAPDAQRPGTLTRLLLRVMGPADVVPPDDEDRRAQRAYRQRHLGEAVEPIGPSPHGELRQVPVPAGARELVARDLEVLASTHAAPRALPAA